MPTRPHLRAELQQCRSLLQLLYEKIALLESTLPFTDEAPSEEYTPAIPEGVAAGLRDTPAIPPYYFTGLANTPAIPNAEPSGLRHTPAIPGRPAAGFGKYHLSLLGPLAGLDKARAIPALPDGTEAALTTLIHQREDRIHYKKVAAGAARILLRLYAQPDARHSNAALAAAAGFSVSGASKHMTHLLRRGLVLRRGWQRFVLTEKALGYIREAAGY